MKILLTKISDPIGYQIFDTWHAYVQHNTHNYANHTEYKITDQPILFDRNDYNISVIIVPFRKLEKFQHNAKNYDLVLICNGGESLKVASPLVKKYLFENTNAFLIANSFLSEEHSMYQKTIWFPDDIQKCRDYWTRYFYPQYFDLHKLRQLQKKNLLCFINGENRTNRQFFIDCCRNLQLDLNIKNSLSTTIAEIADAQWESQPDTDFKNFVNQKYPKVLAEHSDRCYYDLSTTVGIDQAFGKIPPGYFPLPLYFENYCVVFPETGWQNDELNVTEKSLKCFYAESLPFPVGGANINKLYNKLGFFTAWNLLPEHMQKFDSEQDHALRYQMAAESLQWLQNNSEVFYGDQFQQFTNNNKINFLTCSCNYSAVQRFDQLIMRHLH